MIFSFLRNTGSSPKQLFEFLQSGVVIRALRRCLRTRALTIYHSAAVSFLPPKDNTVNIQGRRGSLRLFGIAFPLCTFASSAVKCPNLGWLDLDWISNRCMANIDKPQGHGRPVVDPVFALEINSKPMLRRTAFAVRRSFHCMAFFRSAICPA